MTIKKILLTGSTGFVGTNLVFGLAEDYNLRCLVRKTSNISRIKKFVPEFLIGDVTDYNSLCEAVKGVDFVIHAAALIRARSVKEYYAVNHVGTKNLVNAVLNFNPALERFIFISTQAAVGPSDGFRFKGYDCLANPVSDYGKSKLLAEKEVERLNGKIEFVILRPSVIYGPWDKDLLFLFKLAKFGILPAFSNFFFQLLFVKDLVEICRRLLQRNTGSKIFNVADGNFYSWLNVVKIFEGVYNKKICKLTFLPKFVLDAVSVISEIYNSLNGKPAVLNRQKVNELYCKYWLFDVSDIKRELNFNFTPFEIGASITYSWYVENRWL